MLWFEERFRKAPWTASLTVEINFSRALVWMLPNFKGFLIGAKVYDEDGQTIVEVENVACFILVLHEIPVNNTLTQDNNTRLPILIVVSGCKPLSLLILELFTFSSIQ